MDQFPVWLRAKSSKFEQWVIGRSNLDRWHLMHHSQRRLGQSWVHFKFRPEMDQFSLCFCAKASKFEMFLEFLLPLKTIVKWCAIGNSYGQSGPSKTHKRPLRPPKSWKNKKRLSNFYCPSKNIVKWCAILNSLLKTVFGQTGHTKTPKRPLNDPWDPIKVEKYLKGPRICISHRKVL